MKLQRGLLRQSSVLHDIIIPLSTLLHTAEGWSTYTTRCVGPSSSRISTTSASCSFTCAVPASAHREFALDSEKLVARQGRQAQSPTIF